MESVCIIKVYTIIENKVEYKRFMSQLKHVITEYKY